MRWFFLQKELDKTMYLLCHRLDGSRLLTLYEMCLMNRESMYQALKYELSVRNQLLLPIGDYLTFLHEIKLIRTTHSDGTINNIIHNPQPLQVYHHPCNLF